MAFYPPQPPPSTPEWYTRQRIAESDIERHPQTQVELALYNMMLPYMDPYTQWSMGNMLAQKAPELFGGYAGSQPPFDSTIPNAATPYQRSLIGPVYGPGGAIPQPSRISGNEEYLNRQRLMQALEALTPENLTNQVYGEGLYAKHAGKHLLDVSGRAANLETIHQQQAPMLWLREYLSTAAGGTSAPLPTLADTNERANLPTLTERNLALAHLKTLEDQAQQDPAFQNVLTLGQNLVNPVMERPAPSGGVGFDRTITNPFGDVSRRGVKRNPWLT